MENIQKIGRTTNANHIRSYNRMIRFNKNAIDGPNDTTQPYHKKGISTLLFGNPFLILNYSNIIKEWRNN